MSHTVDQPIFLYLVSVVVVPCVHGIGVTTCYLSVCGARWTIKARIVGVMRSKMIRLHPLSHNLLSVNRIYQVVACSMKGNGWHNTGCTPHSVICSLPLPRLIRRIKPVPTFLLIVRARLLWIDGDELFLIC